MEEHKVEGMYQHHFNHAMDAMNKATHHQDLGKHTEAQKWRAQALHHLTELKKYTPKIPSPSMAALLNPERFLQNLASL